MSGSKSNSKINTPSLTSKAIQSAVITVLIALVLFTPIMGVILDDYDLILNLYLPLTISIILGLARFVQLYIKYNNKLFIPKQISKIVKKLTTRFK